MAAFQGDAWRIVSFSIYGATLIALYFFSALYHSVRGVGAALRKLDHIAIYLLIAGSYTPFTLVTLRGPLGWTLFGAIWGLAVLGIGVDLLFADRRRIIPVVLYILMG
jgi:hemolysin III